MRSTSWHGVIKLLGLAGAAAFLGCSSLPAAAEDVTIGALNTTSTAPVFLAADRGYFTQEGLTPKIVTFDSAQPVAVAAVSGDVDFGVTGLTSAFFSLAGQGALKIVSGAYSERKGFHYNAFVASKKAYAGGLTAMKQLPGHSFSLSQIGSPPHYAIGVVADTLGFSLDSLKLLPLQSIPNQVSALTGDQADAGMLQASVALPMVDRGDVKLIGWLSDVMSWQLGVVFVSSKTANDKADLIHRTMRAIGRGRQDYVAAFIGPDGSLKLGPTSDAVLALLAKHLQQKPEQVKQGLLYMDPQGRLDSADILRQIAWYKSHGMLKGEVDGKAIIDSRYVVPMPPAP
ncbi:MAG TPA: ABC transporter substrate-binding protein [Stellaceae bacterium]|nr:ABC transporter substrate-binding protein [Stellaceae bacterium]